MFSEISVFWNAFFVKCWVSEKFCFLERCCVFWSVVFLNRCFTLESFSIVPLFMSRKLFVYRTNAAVKYLINAAWLFEATPLLLDAPEVVSSVCVAGPLTLLVRNCPSEVQWCSSMCVRVCLVSSLWHGQVQFLSLRSLDGLRKWFALPLQCTSHPFSHLSIHLRAHVPFLHLHPSVHWFIIIIIIIV